MKHLLIVAVRYTSIFILRDLRVPLWKSFVFGDKPARLKAKFVWLKRIEDRPKRAIGFDFDGAEFSHVDSKVTFEVLLTSFGLEGDVGLSRLGTLVHFLDVGGVPVPEAPGLAAIVSGARALAPSDDALLQSVTPALDSLYHTYRVG